MNKIRDWLYIGKYSETNDLELLKHHSIDSMLQFAELVEQPEIQTLYLPIEDGKPLNFSLLREGLDFIHLQKSQERQIMVSCGAGVSRSASFCLAALKESENLDLLSAYNEVKKLHSVAFPHVELWSSLCSFYEEDIPYIEVMRIYRS